MSGRVVRLDQLLRDVAAAPARELAGLSLDSRGVVPGGAFVAVQGARQHGLQHLSQALARGASAVLWEPAPGVQAPALPAGVAGCAVPDLRSRLGELADRYWGSPSTRLAVAGVTGTNGKTTCAWLLAQAITALGSRGAYAGTLGWGFPPAVRGGTHTTPDVLTVHAGLAELLAAGATHAAMEISSHALDQGRVDGVRIGVAAFTNLTRDHLDYHGTMERYAAAKQRLFRHPGLGHAVINVADEAGRAFAAALPAGVALTAVTGEGVRWTGSGRRLAVRGIGAESGGLAIVVAGDFGETSFTAPLVGAFNVDNVAVVLGVLLAWGYPLAAAGAALGGVAAPPGRMEAFSAAGGPLAVVDYAHTPDALAKVLRAARAHCTGRLIVVFGCGGDRDAGKRPLMGAVAEQLADEIWLTDDNPRTEDGAGIVAAIRAGLQRPAAARIERDRAAAIALAIHGAGAGDVVIVAGKGHEDYQIVGDESRPFSDRDEVRRQLGRAA